MWIQPKTWKHGDYFNVEDYNRIKNNLRELRELAVVMYPEFSIYKMGPDKNYQDYGFYADEINLFEDNLRAIRNGIYPYWTGGTKIWYDNQPFPDYNDLNRIEEGLNIMYQNLMGQYKGRLRLPGILGRGRCAVCR